MIYGGGYRATNGGSTWEETNYVKIGNGNIDNILASATLSRVPTTGGTANGGNLYTYVLTGDFDLMDAMKLNWGDSFEVLFATATCANSGMYAQVATQTPEPGTIALLGLGLIGLFFGRKRFSRK
jgi:hypothetical protein